jgi:hypothetical protein
MVEDNYAGGTHQLLQLRRGAQRLREDGADLSRRGVGLLRGFVPRSYRIEATPTAPDTVH